MGVAESIKNLFLGGGGGVTAKELLSFSERDRFSRFLPWVAYDPDTHQYLLQDNTVSLMWECAPLFFAGESTTKALEGLFRQGFPDKTIMQFVLVGEPHVSPLLRSHIRLKNRRSRLVARMADSLCSYYDNGKSGMKMLGGVPLRNYRSFLCLSFRKLTLPD